MNVFVNIYPLGLYKTDGCGYAAAIEGATIIPTERISAYPFQPMDSRYVIRRPVFLFPQKQVLPEEP